MLTHNRIIVGVVASSILLAGANGSCNSSSSNFSVGPSAGQVAGVILGASAIIIGAVVLVEVNQHHHNLKGCVTSTPAGLQIFDTNDQIYTLTGTTGDLKVGDRVHVHGQKQQDKTTKDRTFIVQKMSKDYGPCKATSNQTPAVPAPTH